MRPIVENEADDEIYGVEMESAEVKVARDDDMNSLAMGRGSGTVRGSGGPCGPCARCTIGEKRNKWANWIVTLNVIAMQTVWTRKCPILWWRETLSTRKGIIF